MKRIAALMLSLLLVFSLTASAAQIFPDVPESHWAAEDIAKAQAYGLMQGYEDGSFAPDDDLTRASFAAILCRMFSWVAQSRRAFHTKPYLSNTGLNLLSQSSF